MQRKSLLERIKVINIGKYNNSNAIDVSMNKSNSENFHIDSVIHFVCKFLSSSDVIWKMTSDEAIATQ